VFDVSQIPLFALANQRLAWIDQRQQVLAQNIANIDTPGWRTRDLTPFDASLAHANLELTRTDGAHLAGAAGGGGTAGRAQVVEQAPDKNGVSLDKELEKVAESDTAHELVTELTRKYLGLVRTAIGK
jgi:flagellar basal-body rod protein FlgB